MASSRTAFVSVSGVADLRVPSGLIRPAEVWPREVRFAHPCRARARHPIHKAITSTATPPDVISDDIKCDLKC